MEMYNNKTGSYINKEDRQRPFHLFVLLQDIPAMEQRMVKLALTVLSTFCSTIFYRRRQTGRLICLLHYRLHLLLYRLRLLQILLPSHLPGLVSRR